MHAYVAIIATSILRSIFSIKYSILLVCIHVQHPIGVGFFSWVLYYRNKTTFDTTIGLALTESSKLTPKTINAPSSWKKWNITNKIKGGRKDATWKTENDSANIKSFCCWDGYFCLIGSWWNSSEAMDAPWRDIETCEENE